LEEILALEVPVAITEAGEQGGLSGARGAHDGEGLAFGLLKVDLPE